MAYYRAGESCFYIPLLPPSRFASSSPLDCFDLIIYTMFAYTVQCTHKTTSAIQLCVRMLHLDSDELRYMFAITLTFVSAALHNFIILLLLLATLFLELKQLQRIKTGRIVIQSTWKAKKSVHSFKAIGLIWDNVISQFDEEKKDTKLIHSIHTVYRWFSSYDTHRVRHNGKVLWRSCRYSTKNGYYFSPILS